MSYLKLDTTHYRVLGVDLYESHVAGNEKLDFYGCRHRWSLNKDLAEIRALDSYKRSQARKNRTTRSRYEL